MTADVLYNPSDWQLRYHGLTHHEALGAGAAGPGKSYALLMDPVMQVMIEHERCHNPRHPYHMRWGDSTGAALHLRRTFPMLRETIIRSHKIFPRIDPGAKYDTQAATWTFASGYRYAFGHCNDPNDWGNYQSSQYSYIAFDELSQFTEEQYDQICTRLRSSDPVLSKMLKIRSMSNPVMLRSGDTFTVDDPYWVRKRFVDPAPDGNVTLKRKVMLREGKHYWRTWIYLPASLYDNPDKAYVETYERELAAKPPLIRQALLYGNWYVTEGSFYGQVWNDRLHTCKPFKIPDDWKKFRSMDWGYKAPGIIGWFAMDPDGTLYLYREMGFQGKSDEQVAGMVKEIEQAEGIWSLKRSSITGPADTQLWERRGEGNIKTKAETFHKLGVPWVPAMKNATGSGSRKVGGRVGNAERLLMRLSDHDNGTKTPGIVFFNTCQKTIKCLQSIQTRPGTMDEPLDGGDDHPHDMVLYAVAFASRGTKGIPSKVDEREDEDDDEPRAPKPRGRHVGYGVYT